jgi:hypothetical protein
MKACSSCLQKLPLESFTKDSSKTSGFGSLCKPCAAEKRRVYHAKMKADPKYKAIYQARNAAWRLNNKELALASTAKWVAENPEKVHAIKTRSADKTRADRNARLREKSATTPGWQTEKANRWRKNNRDKARSALQKRRVALTKALPLWFGELDAFVITEANALACVREQKTGVKWHVDHVIPLRGKKVSGLHVWNNVRVIPALVNIRKSNQYEV